MLPRSSTAWFGIVTKLPGEPRLRRNEKAARRGLKNRHADDIADTKMEGQGRAVVGEGIGKSWLVSVQGFDDFGVSLTRAYGRLWAARGTMSALAETTSSPAGPLAGISEQPPRRKAEAIKTFSEAAPALYQVTRPLSQAWANTAWRRPTKEGAASK